MFDPSTIKFLVNEHGHNVTLRRITNGSYDVATGVLSTTTTDFVVKAYPHENTNKELQWDNYIAGDKVYAICTLPASLTTPINTGYQIVDGTTILSVNSVKEIKSNNTVMVYLLLARE